MASCEISCQTTTISHANKPNSCPRTQALNYHWTELDDTVAFCFLLTGIMIAKVTHKPDPNRALPQANKLEANTVNQVK